MDETLEDSTVIAEIFVYNFLCGKICALGYLRNIYLTKGYLYILKTWWNTVLELCMQLLLSRLSQSLGNSCRRNTHLQTRAVKHYGQVCCCWRFLLRFPPRGTIHGMTGRPRSSVDLPQGVIKILCSVVIPCSVVFRAKAKETQNLVRFVA